MTVKFAQTLAGLALAAAGVVAVYIAWRVYEPGPAGMVLRGAVTGVGLLAVVFGALLIGQQA